jgi:hypothetical protein
MRIGRGNRRTRKKNLSQCHFVYHKSHSNAGRRGGNLVTNRLSYGTAYISILRWRSVVNFMLRPLYPVGKNPDIVWTGGWVSPRGELDAVEKKKNFFICRELNPGYLGLPGHRHMLAGGGIKKLQG